jgi:hypothetical protein
MGQYVLKHLDSMDDYDIENVKDYLESVEGLSTSHREKMDLIRADNELAINAAKLEQMESKKRGIPVS